MNTLLLAEGTLTPSCTKSHIRYTFNLAGKAERLNIRFSYEPKKLDDLERSMELIQEGICSFIEEGEKELKDDWETYLPVQNLLTVSVDDSKGFRGCVHRHSPLQHLFIAGESASPGLIQGPVLPGYWSVTISVHAVVTGICCYRLHVWEGDE